MGEVCRAEHIAVGSEILLGQIANGHARTISLELAKHGLFLYYHTAVGDNLERIIDAFATASRRTNVVIVTGGLGPTNDDLTKEALASYLDRPLHLSEAALQTLEAFFQRYKRPMPASNRKQAMCIEGGELLPNPNGTAPGQYVAAGGVHYFLLPGPPREMLPMLRDEVVPRLKALFPGEQTLVSRVLHFCGIGESAVDEQIADLTAMTNPTVAPLAGEGEMLLRITASDVSEEAARARIAPVEARLRSQFGRFLYGTDDDTLESVVGGALRERGQTLSLAESCTGGLIASLITSVPGASAYFAGGTVVYQNETKIKLLGVQSRTLDEHGAVSEQTAKEMAEGVRAACASSYGLSVTGIAGPSGGTPEKPVGLVYGAIAGPAGTRVYQMQFKGSRDQIRLRTAKMMLWRLWETLVQP
ncbi:competence/damage-inducible protein A [Alicyclobacillus cycloheptanicus]|uniref:Putative competence-damage inducible protein n=1 Tax=Alicyclobacillus cycloheptanicus TaxID=1457 RepID=A0ABT9XG78_9BACL|nr:competence/damage-inducible protein A [Alicyclobacillus cycloheptanicus]MDQ0189294.1 nicotinamide-nucleotide amidase [Alicyclobacillus cycloheptanicus]WDM01342.1 competence/damage-inducible protein A [Alicyclobacillus cycloheptanicus]